MDSATTLRRRIELAEELRSVTGTMKSLSAVTTRHYERSLHALHEYARTVELGLTVVLRSRPALVPVAAAGAVTQDCLVVVFGSARGLCGPINRHIAAAASETVRSVSGAPTVVAVGARCALELDAAGLQPSQIVEAAASVDSIRLRVQQMLVHIDGWRSTAGGRVALVHPRPVAAGRPYEVQTVPLLPLDAPRLRALAGARWPTRQLPQWRGAWSEVFAALTRQLLFVDLHRAFAETQVCVHRSRLAAMQSAEDNIAERLEQLTLRYHHQRQAAITDELLDVVSGYEAVRG